MFLLGVLQAGPKSLLGIGYPLERTWELGYPQSQDWCTPRTGYAAGGTPHSLLEVSFVKVVYVFGFTSKTLRSFSEEVHLVTAGVEPQQFVISSDDVTPLAFYVIKPSMSGSRLEVIIEDGITNSSQMVNERVLCGNVEVRYSIGRFLIR